MSAVDAEVSDHFHHEVGREPHRRGRQQVIYHVIMMLSYSYNI